MRLHRMISILLLIEAKGKVKAKELAEEFETSVRTIYRDVDALCEAGIPLRADTGPNGGIQFIEGYTVGIKDLNREDIMNLYLSSMGIKSGKQSDMALKVNTALLKLQKNISPQFEEDLKILQRRFYVDDVPWWGEASKLSHVDMLMQAVWQFNKLNIAYQKPMGQVEERTIRPYGIVVNQMDWYLVAYCEKNKDIRTFKCERIIKCKYMLEKFSLPIDFSIEECWKKSKQLFKSQCGEKEKYPVVIKLHKQRVDILKDFEVYQIEEVDHYIEATINMYKYDCAKEDILKIISYVEVLNPPELRSYVQHELHNMIKRYNQRADD